MATLVAPLIPDSIRPALVDHAELQDRLDALHQESFGWALACCRRDRTEAEDVLQTVYLQVLDGRARFDGRASFKTWLFAVIRRTAASERRRSMMRRLLLERQWRPESSVVADAETRLDQDGRVERLTNALRTLAPRQHAVLELVFYHDLTIEDAATVMGVSLGTARTHYERAKKRLAALLNGDLR
jgi:RNA polymerase sigma-70 factor (ECF subfamily)